LPLRPFWLDRLEDRPDDRLLLRLLRVERALLLPRFDDERTERLDDRLLPRDRTERDDWLLPRDRTEREEPELLRPR